MIKYIAGLIMGILIMIIFTSNQDIKIINSSKVYTRRIVEPDYDTIPFLHTDTFYVDATEYHIPIFSYKFNDSLCYRVNSRDNFLYLNLLVQGYVKEYGFEYSMPNIKIEQKKSFLPYAIGFVAGVGMVYLASKL